VLLSDTNIRHALEDGALKIQPFHPGSMQPSSVDLRLGHTFRVADPLTTEAASSSRDNSDLFTEVYVPEGEKFLLPPGGFALAHTHEIVTLNNHLAARVEGKSSLGRNGQAVHITAGFIDPGFSGQVVLELFNHLPVAFEYEPGQKIAQLCIFGISTPVDVAYGMGEAGSHYQNQTGPQPSLSHINYNAVNVYEESK